MWRRLVFGRGRKAGSVGQESWKEDVLKWASSI